MGSGKQYTVACGEKRSAARVAVSGPSARPFMTSIGSRTSVPRDADTVHGMITSRMRCLSSSSRVCGEQASVKLVPFIVRTSTVTVSSASYGASSASAGVGTGFGMTGGALLGPWWRRGAKGFAGAATGDAGGLGAAALFLLAGVRDAAAAGGAATFAGRGVFTGVAAAFLLRGCAFGGLTGDLRVWLSGVRFGMGSGLLAFSKFDARFAIARAAALAGVLDTGFFARLAGEGLLAFRGDACTGFLLALAGVAAAAGFFLLGVFTAGAAATAGALFVVVLVTALAGARGADLLAFAFREPAADVAAFFAGVAGGGLAAAGFRAGVLLALALEPLLGRPQPR